jgi:hypothetical protein
MRRGLTVALPSRGPELSCPSHDPTAVRPSGSPEPRPEPRPDTPPAGTRGTVPAHQRPHHAPTTGLGTSLWWSGDRGHPGGK